MKKNNKTLQNKFYKLNKAQNKKNHTLLYKQQFSNLSLKELDHEIKNKLNLLDDFSKTNFALFLSSDYQVLIQQWVYDKKIQILKLYILLLEKKDA